MAEHFLRNELEIQPAERVRDFTACFIAFFCERCAEVVPIGRGIVTVVDKFPHDAESIGDIRDSTVFTASVPEIMSVEVNAFAGCRTGDQYAGQTVAQRQGVPPHFTVTGSGFFQRINMSAHDIVSFYYIARDWECMDA